jgi:tripartite-type tricarboxylate transporter receptor subunit TctC
MNKPRALAPSLKESRLHLEEPQMKIRQSLAIGISLFVILLPAKKASAEQTNYPTKPINLIVPFSAGGRTDLIGRLVAKYLSTDLGVGVVVINKPGAGSVLGANEVAHAAPDGYTVGFFSTSAVTAQYTVPTPISLADYELVAIINTDPAAIAVQETAPWKTLKDLVTDVRKQPNRYRIGMIPGASAQIFAAGLSHATNIKMIEVPFKGDTEGAVALAGNHIEIHVAVPVSYKSLVAAKKIRILAVAAARRSALYDNLPTFRENGVDLAISAFHGIFVPKGTPAAIVDRLADAIEKIASTQGFVDGMRDAGAGVEFLRGEEARQFLSQQDATYRTIIDELGLRVPASK